LLDGVPQHERRFEAGGKEPVSLAFIDRQNGGTAAGELQLAGDHLLTTLCVCLHTFQTESRKLSRRVDSLCVVDDGRINAIEFRPDGGQHELQVMRTADNHDVVCAAPNQGLPQTFRPVP